MHQGLVCFFWEDNLPQCRSGTDFDRSASAPAATHHRPPLVQSSSSGSSASFQSAQSFDESSNMPSPGAADKLFVSIPHSAFFYSRNFYIYVLFFICLFVLIMIKFFEQQETHDEYIMLPSWIFDIHLSIIQHIQYFMFINFYIIVTTSFILLENFEIYSFAKFLFTNDPQKYANFLNDDTSK